MALAFEPSFGRRSTPRPQLAADVAGFMAAVGLAVSRGWARERMLADCARAMVDQLGASAAFIWRVSADGSRLHLAAGRGASREICGGYDGLPVGDDLPGRVVSTRARMAVDLWSDAAPPDSTWAKKRGLRAFAAYPLVLDGRVVGVIGLYLWHHAPALDDAIGAGSMLMALAAGGRDGGAEENVLAPPIATHGAH